MTDAALSGCRKPLSIRLGDAQYLPHIEIRSRHSTWVILKCLIYWDRRLLARTFTIMQGSARPLYVAQ